MQPGDVLTSAEVCGFLGITRPTLYSWIAAGRLTPWKELGPGEPTLFLKNAVLQSPLRKYERLGHDPKIVHRRKSRLPVEETRILLVALKKSHIDEISGSLQKSGMVLLRAETLDEASGILRTENPEAVIISPDQAGWQQIPKIKRLIEKLDIEVPPALLALSSQFTSPEDSARAIKSGALDFFKIPIPKEVLLARLRWMIRRRLWTEMERVDNADETISSRWGLVNVHPETRTLHIRENTRQTEFLTSRLTRKEMNLLRLFLKRPGRIFSRRMLLEIIWGYSVNIRTRTVDRHIENLRYKLGSLGSRIESHYGLGYRFLDDPFPSSSNKSL